MPGPQDSHQSRSRVAAHQHKPKPRTTKKAQSEGYPKPVSQPETEGLQKITAALDGLEWYYSGISALDCVFKRPHGGYCFILVKASITELAKRIDRIVFPGIEGIDACADMCDGRYYFICYEGGPVPRAGTVAVLDFYWDPAIAKPFDPRENYKAVRNKQWEPEKSADGRYTGLSAESIVDLAIYASRFLSGIDPSMFVPLDEELWPGFGIEEQRRTLSLILSGPFAEKGLAVLHQSGYTKFFLPELIAMDGTRHSKEGHPEGNVWQHSLETLRYRKIADLTLGLGLLLHDSGKPHAVPTRQKMFDKHAELGAELAYKLLRRLGFTATVTRDVCWLVEHHMIPQALAELPLSRTESLMDHDLFPLLLELYRCDLVSTWRGPEGYYEACKKFRAWLKIKRNPYMSLDRKKQIQSFVAS